MLNLFLVVSTEEKYGDNGNLSSFSLIKSVYRTLEHNSELLFSCWSRMNSKFVAV